MKGDSILPVRFAVKVWRKTANEVGFPRPSLAPDDFGEKDCCSGFLNYRLGLFQAAGLNPALPAAFLLQTLYLGAKRFQ